MEFTLIELEQQYNGEKMTIKHMTKNISAEDITTLFDIQVQRDNNNQINHIILTRKNFYEGEADTSHDLLDYFYTKTQIDDRVKVHLKIYPTKAALDSATDSDAEQENYIYLVPYGNTGDHNEGRYEEYIYAKDSNGTYYYEEIGSTELDLQPILTRISNLETGKEDKSNIVTSWSSTTSDTKYPSEKLVKDTVNSINNDIDSCVKKSEIEELPLEFTYSDDTTETINFIVKKTTINNGA